MSVVLIGPEPEDQWGWDDIPSELSFIVDKGFAVGSHVWYAKDLVRDGNLLPAGLHIRHPRRPAQGPARYLSPFEAVCATAAGMGCIWASPIKE